MQNKNKLLQAIGIPHSALMSVIFGMMFFSFPLGVFVMFQTNLGDDITYEFPINDFDLLLAGFGISIPIGVQTGDAFIVIWAIFVILFTIAMMGPKEGFLKTMSSLLSHGKLLTKSNYMVAITKWFSILILISAIINFIQEKFGVSTIPPAVSNDLIQFFYVTLSPLTEEIGFRVLLIGLPLFAFYSHKKSIKFLFKSLWSPSTNLHIHDSKKAIILIVLVAIFFGISHIISGEPWSNGKFAQATASGIILGWLYFRFGLITAIMVHWATNYFVFAYVNFISQISLISVNEAFDHPLVSTMEIIFVVAGILSVAVLMIDKFYNKKRNLPTDLMQP